MKMLMLGGPFMLPFWSPAADVVFVDLEGDVEAQVAGNRDAAFGLAYQAFGHPGVVEKIVEARDLCRAMDIPTVWHTIEDPLAFGAFFAQAKGYDLICTGDDVLVPIYAQEYPESKVIWLPMAAQPALHVPHPLNSDAADLILLANYYRNDARQESHDNLVDPLLDAGCSLALYAYEAFRWPEKYDRWYRGASYHLDSAKHYSEGKIALGISSEVRGSGMCSMRIFEVLCCGKPMLSYHNDAYEKLGFVNAMPDLSVDGHFVWVDNKEDALIAARALLGNPAAAQAMADRGREFVLRRHTYKQRLETILENVCEHAI